MRGYDAVPRLDVEIGDLTDVSGFPVSFVPHDDGDFPLGYGVVPMVIPDDVEPYTLEGEIAKVTAILHIREGETLEFQRELVLHVSK